VELAVHLKTLKTVDTALIRPPYGASLPDTFDPVQDSPGPEWHGMETMPTGLRSVYSSVTNHDFSWYVLREICGEFFSAKLADPVAPTRRDLYETFRRGLTAAQLRAWEGYRGPELTLTEWQHRLDELLTGPEETPTEEHLSEAEARVRFEATLSDQQRDVFRREVRPYVEDGFPGQARRHIALVAAQEFVLDFVRAVGWRAELV
jgi:hypothetical protein